MGPAAAIGTPAVTPCVPHVLPSNSPLHPTQPTAPCLCSASSSALLCLCSALFCLRSASASAFALLHLQLIDYQKLPGGGRSLFNTGAGESPSKTELVELRVFVRKGGKLKYELDGLRWKSSYADDGSGEGPPTGGCMAGGCVYVGAADKQLSTQLRVGCRFGLWDKLHAD